MGEPHDTCDQGHNSGDRTEPDNGSAPFCDADYLVTLSQLPRSFGWWSNSKELYYQPEKTIKNGTNR
jgi:hypothetical protein